MIYFLILNIYKIYTQFLDAIKMILIIEIFVILGIIAAQQMILSSKSDKNIYERFLGYFPTNMPICTYIEPDINHY